MEVSFISGILSFSSSENTKTGWESFNHSHWSVISSSTISVSIPNEFRHQEYFPRLVYEKRRDRNWDDGWRENDGLLSNLLGENRKAAPIFFCPGGYYVSLRVYFGVADLLNRSCISQLWPCYKQGTPSCALPSSPSNRITEDQFSFSSFPCCLQIKQIYITIL